MYSSAVSDPNLPAGTPSDCWPKRAVWPPKQCVFDPSARPAAIGS